MTLNSPNEKIGLIPFDGDGFTIYKTEKGILIEQDFGFDVELTKKQVIKLVSILVAYLNTSEEL